MNARQSLTVAGLVLGACILSVGITAGTMPTQVESVNEDGGAVAPDSIAEALDTPCLTEDSENCYWRADLRGNHVGESFVNIEGHVFPLADLLAGE